MGRQYTGGDCAAMTMRQLRRLCDEAFRELDIKFPAWGARERYEMLHAEITDRAEKIRNQPGPTVSREVFHDNPASARFEMFHDGASVGFIRYELTNGLLTILITYVHARFRSHSADVIPVLLRQMMLNAHRRRLAVLPVCPHSVRFLAAHPEYAALAPAADRTGRPLAGRIREAARQGAAGS
jgi:predicted GNAT family acetyltransferase